MLKRLSTWSVVLSLTLLLAGLPVACTGGEGARQDPDVAETAPYVVEEIDPEAYAAEILASRAERDEQYASLEFSPLAVVAIARLDKERTTIGSDESADLPLLSPDVAPLHAEILPSEVAGGSDGFLLRAVDGVLWTAGEPSLRLAEMDFDRGARARIGHYTVYSDSLGTLGAVVRALDFSTPAFTEFTGLEYYPPDPAYVVAAAVTPYEEAEEIRMIDTRGWERPAWRYGEAAFTLHGEDLRLVLLTWVAEPGPGDQFFIALTDATSGEETYPACRYVQPGFVAEGPLLLDFNLAFNPSCAYNDGFACPLPPRENRLQVPIRAGEKIYPHHH
jgi:uncharacterized protein (DUF1684 family)